MKVIGGVGSGEGPAIRAGVSMEFIGIDLSWNVAPPKTGGTGLCRLSMDGQVLDLRVATTDDEIESFVRESPQGEVAVGIDAPLVVPQEEGRRPCELELLSRYRIHAHSSNRKRLSRVHSGIRGELLCSRLLGFGFDLRVAPGGPPGRWIYEVYPGPTVKALTDQGTLHAYKHGRIGTRATAIQLILARLEERDHIVAPQMTRTVREWSAVPPSGFEVQRATDELDALISAELARDFWRGEPGDRVSVVGNRRDGFVVFRPGLPPV